MLGRGGAVHDHLGPPHQAILAVVGEGQALTGDLEGTHLPEQLKPIAADVKHVAKVGFNSQRAFDLDRLAAGMSPISSATIMIRLSFRTTRPSDTVPIIGLVFHGDARATAPYVDNANARLMARWCAVDGRLMAR